MAEIFLFPPYLDLPLVWLTIEVSYLIKICTVLGLNHRDTLCAVLVQPGQNAHTHKSLWPKHTKRTRWQWPVFFNSWISFNLSQAGLFKIHTYLIFIWTRVPRGPMFLVLTLIKLRTSVNICEYFYRREDLYVQYVHDNCPVIRHWKITSEHTQVRQFIQCNVIISFPYCDGITL